MEQKPEIDELELEHFFAAERAMAPKLNQEVLSRIVAQGLEHQTVPTGKFKPKRASWAHQIASVLGGWPAASALTACAVAGVYLGYAFPVEELVGYSTATIADAEQYSSDLSGLLDPDFSFLEG